MNNNNNLKLEEIEEEAANHAINKKLRNAEKSTSDYEDEEYEKENKDEKLPWQPEDLNNLDYLNYLHDWNFPIFKFSNNSPDFVLSQMAYKIFSEVGLFKTFEIPVNQFIHYFTQLEKGYFDLPCIDFVLYIYFLSNFFFILSYFLNKIITKYTQLMFCMHVIISVHKRYLA